MADIETQQPDEKLRLQRQRLGMQLLRALKRARIEAGLFGSVLRKDDYYSGSDLDIAIIEDRSEVKSNAHNIVFKKLRETGDIYLDYNLVYLQKVESDFRDRISRNMRVLDQLPCNLRLPTEEESNRITLARAQGMVNGIHRAIERIDVPPPTGVEDAWRCVWSSTLRLQVDLVKYTTGNIIKDVWRRRWHCLPRAPLDGCIRVFSTNICELLNSLPEPPFIERKEIPPEELKSNLLAIADGVHREVLEGRVWNVPIP